MRNFLLSTTAAIVLGAGGAFAQSIADEVIPQLQAQGYNSIEVKTGPTQIKFEAYNAAGNKFEAVYDVATRLLISSEFGPADDDEDATPGVKFDSDDQDFTDDSNDDDSSDDGKDDDNSDDDDDRNDRDDNDDDSGDDDDKDDDRDDDKNDDRDDDSGDDNGDDD